METLTSPITRFLRGKKRASAARGLCAVGGDYGWSWGQHLLLPDLGGLQLGGSKRGTGEVGAEPGVQRRHSRDVWGEMATGLSQSIQPGNMKARGTCGWCFLGSSRSLDTNVPCVTLSEAQARGLEAVQLLCCCCCCWDCWKPCVDVYGRGWEGLQGIPSPPWDSVYLSVNKGFVGRGPAV